MFWPGLVVQTFFFAIVVMARNYTPDWPSLDSRPLPAWYDDVKLGIFMHFGPYAVPGVESEWFWYQTYRNESEGDQRCVKYMQDYFPPKFTYQDFGPMLQMEFFNASDIARVVAESGAKYFVFTSKHHDGFCNWPSTYTYGWNSMAIGPKRDVIMELKLAFEKDHPDIHFGLYYSLFEWFNPIHQLDQDNNKTTRFYPLNKMLPEMKELVTRYAPHVIWSDGDWTGPPEYYGSKDFLAWLYNDSPSKDFVVTNDRWGIGTVQKHGGYFSGPDRFNPGVLQEHKWEQCLSTDIESWGIRRNIELDDILTPEKIIWELASTVSCGGNLLLNVGPTKEGTIIPIFQERLKQLGGWMKVNGEAIYGTRPWIAQNDTLNGNVWYTSKVSTVYAIVLEWPDDETLVIEAPKADHTTTKITMVGMPQDQTLDFIVATDRLHIMFPSMSKVFKTIGDVSMLGTVLKLEGLKKASPTVEVVKN